jgi:hypothetical protein
MGLSAILRKDGNKLEPFPGGLSFAATQDTYVDCHGWYVNRIPNALIYIDYSQQNKFLCCLKNFEFSMIGKWTTPAT